MNKNDPQNDNIEDGNLPVKRQKIMRSADADLTGSLSEGKSVLEISAIEQSEWVNFFKKSFAQKL